MTMTGTKTIELEVCNAYVKTYVQNKPFMLLIKNKLDATKSKTKMSPYWTQVNLETTGQ